MPTYSYLCGKCEKKFDAFHSMHCTDPQLCPICGERGKKLMSAGSIIFKGTGFYSTDYRDSGYIEAQKRESDEPSSSKAPEKPASPATGAAAPAGGETPTPKKEPQVKKDSTPKGGTSSGDSNPPPAKSAGARDALPRSL